MQRILRYPCFEDACWSIEVLEGDWNEIERAFVAVLDAAFSDEEAARAGKLCRYEDTAIPDFGCKLTFGYDCNYYASLVDDNMVDLLDEYQARLGFQKEDSDDD